MQRTLLKATLAAAVIWSLVPVTGDAGPPPHRPPREICRLLDDPELRPLMDAVLNHLLPACGREHELGGVFQPSGGEVPVGRGASRGPDTQVNDPSGDSGLSQTQSETSLARSEVSGTLCAGYNDSFHRVQGNGVTGFSRSTDGGTTFHDQGALDPDSDGDPSLVWRRADGHFYFTTLADGGVRIWRSTDDCRRFTPVGFVHEGGSDDKELMTVDNHVGSPYFGRLYVVWTDFATRGIRLARSDDGGESWSSPVLVSLANVSVQGAWPAAASTGDLYVAWTRFATGRFSIEIARSSDGGRNFVAVTPPAVDRVRPEDPEATLACARPALNGFIRYAPFPQLAVGPDGVLHVVYSADPDGGGTGDTVDVYYRRSNDHGASWGLELRLNDDQTRTDQFFPSLSVGANNVVSVSWYDRRLDPSNLLFDHFARRSQDGGLTWGASVRVSDSSSSVWLDPAMSLCYHSDYDSHLQDPGRALILWSDDRNVQAGHPDPDVFMDPQPVSDDFLIVPEPWSRSVCAPEDASYSISVPQFAGFGEPVSLQAVGLPDGLTADFSVDPVVLPGASEMVLSGTSSVAAGSYPATIVGTSSPRAAVRQATVTVAVFTIAPPPPVQLDPAAGSVGVDVRPSFSWEEAEQARSYDLQVAADADFAQVVYAFEGDATVHRLTTLLEPESEYFWRVRASNPCGDGPWSPPAEFTTRWVPPLLLVDDDDNEPDVAPAYVETLTALGRSFDIWDTVNSDVEPTAAELALYRTVIWFSGGEYGGAAGPGREGSQALQQWLDGGEAACVLMSGQDILWDRGLTPLLLEYFGIAGVDDDTSQTTVSGAGSIFGGLGPYALQYPFVNYSDTLTPAEGTEAAFVGDQGVAAVFLNGAGFRTAFLAFPLEAVPTAADRLQVLERFLDACAILLVDGFESGDTSAWSATHP